jgi:hypothetical protein
LRILGKGKKKMEERRTTTTKRRWLHRRLHRLLGASASSSYRALAAASARWDRAPLRRLLAGWNALAPEKRAALLARTRVFCAELSATDWRRSMLLRDDARMLAASAPSADDGMALDMIATGAARCLARWARMRGWPDGDWTPSLLRELRAKQQQQQQQRDAEKQKEWCEKTEDGDDEEEEEEDDGAENIVENQVDASNAALAGFGAEPMIILGGGAGDGVMERRQLHNRDFFTMAAVELGHWGAIRTLVLRGGCALPPQAVHSAAARGHRRCLALLIERLHCCSAESEHGRVAAAAAAGEGRLGCLVYLRDRQRAPLGALAAILAAGGAHLGCLRFALARGAPANEVATAAAAAAGSVACLRTLRARGCAWDARAARAAAQAGRLSCLRFLHARGCPFNSSVSICAAAGGHVDCMRFLVLEARRPWSPLLAPVNAAANGHTDCLRMLLTEPPGAPFFVAATAAAAPSLPQALPPPPSDRDDDHATTAQFDLHTVALFAARNGNLACLQLLFELHTAGAQLPTAALWNELTCAAAAVGGHVDCLRFALDNGCAFFADHTVELAAEHGQLATLRYLLTHRRGAGGRAATYAAAANGRLRCLQLLRANGCRWDAFECARVAARERYPRTLAWIRAQISATQTAVAEAVERRRRRRRQGTT